MPGSKQARAAVAALTVALLALPAAAAPPVAKRTPAFPDCRPPAIGKSIPFSPGEKLEYRLEALGLEIGSLSLTTVPGRRPDAYTIVARGRSDPFAEDFYAVEALAESHLGRTLENRAYDEDDTEDGVHRSLSVQFPPRQGSLPVRSTREGNPNDYTLRAPPDTRDMLAALYSVRTSPLPNGSSVCIPIFGARRIWLLRGTVTGREKVQTPAGEFKAIHLAGSASRLDAPQVAREVHIWLSDDADRIPVSALGLVQGKMVQSQLVKYTPGIAKRKK